MRYAVIDIGANTARMNIYDTAENIRPFTRVLSEYQNLGLLNYVESKIVTRTGTDRLLETLTEFTALAQNVRCDDCFYFATASLRYAENAAEVLTAAKNELDIEIETVSGENEALLSFEGLKMSFGEDINHGIMIDMGGGSTEIIGFVDGLAVRTVCLRMGCLTLYREYVRGILPEKRELKAMRDAIDKKIDDICWLKNYGSSAYLVGGTARAAGDLHHILSCGKESGENSSAMSYKELRRIYNYIKKPDRETVKTLVRTHPDRLHTLIPGIYLLLRILKAAEAEDIIISPTGIREGYLAQHLKQTAK